MPSLKQRRGFFLGAVPAGDRVFGGEQARHDGLAHVAKAEETDFHEAPLSI